MFNVSCAVDIVPKTALKHAYFVSYNSIEFIFFFVALLMIILFKDQNKTFAYNNKKN